MTHRLTPEGYAQTKVKLANMEARLAACRARTDLNPIHKQEAERSYIDMMRQYKREIKLYEMHRAERDPGANGTASTQGTASPEGVRPVE